MRDLPMPASPESSTTWRSPSLDGGRPKAAVQLIGEPRYHGVVGDSCGVLERGFCQTCGSQLTMKVERQPDVLVLQAGCLDDPSVYKPVMDVFTASAQPWDLVAPDLQKYAQAPPP